jgi:hypothetical protein
LPLDIAGLAEGRAKRGNLERRINCRPAAEHTDHRYRRLLRARRERPRGRHAADERDELASFKLIDRRVQHVVSTP